LEILFPFTWDEWVHPLLDVDIEEVLGKNEWDELYI